MAKVRLTNNLGEEVFEDISNEFKSCLCSEDLGNKSIQDKIINTIIAMNNSNHASRECHVWIYVDNEGYYDNEYKFKASEIDEPLRNIITTLTKWYPQLIIHETKAKGYIGLSFYPLANEFIQNKKEKQYYYRVNSSTTPFDYNDKLILNMLKKRKGQTFFIVPNRELIPYKAEEFIAFNNLKNQLSSSLPIDHYQLYNENRYLTTQGLIFHDVYKFYNVLFDEQPENKINFYLLKELFFNTAKAWFKEEVYINDYQKVVIGEEFNNDGLLLETLRELFFNAITHLDCESSLPIKISFKKNEFKISNPIRPDFKYEENSLYKCLRNNKQPGNMPQNRTIYATFSLLKLIEQKSRGFTTIKKLINTHNNINVYYDFSKDYELTVHIVIGEEKIKPDNKHLFKI